jgi:hypothetical protein
MAIETSCPHCRQPHQLSENREGKQVRCRVCNRTFRVRTTRSRKRGRRGPAVVLVCGLAGLAFLIVGGVLLYHAWNRGDLGGSGTPDRDIVGRWVDRDLGATFEFRRDGTFLRDSNNLFAHAMLPESGSYHFLDDNLVEIHPLSPELGIPLPPWVVEVYTAPEELCVFVGSAVGQDIRNPGTGGYRDYHCRRDGKTGPIPAGKGIGGSPEDLRRRVRGRWRYEQECLEFTADDHLKYAYRSFVSDCKYTDGKTVELTDKGGRHALEVYCGKDMLRVLHFNLDAEGKRLPPSIVSPNMFTATRIPDDDHDDDPLAGPAVAGGLPAGRRRPPDVKALIVGEWEFQQPAINKGMPGPVLRFDRKGQYAKIFTDWGDGSKHTESGSYRLRPDNQVELTEDPFLPVLAGVQEIKPKVYRVLFTARKLALIDVANSQFQDGSGKLRYIELPEVYRRVAAGGN